VSGTLSAPLAAGESVQVLRDGAVINATVAVDGNTWRMTDTRVADGTHTYAARVVDADGAGPAGAGYRIVVDTQNDKTATITSITYDVAPGVGIVRDGGTTDDPTPTLNGRLSSSLEAGEELQVLRNGTVISNSPQVDGTGWAFSDGPLANGNYDYTVRIVDAAGNVGRASSVYDLRVLRSGLLLPLEEQAVAGDDDRIAMLSFDDVLSAAAPTSAGLAPTANALDATGAIASGAIASGAIESGVMGSGVIESAAWSLYTVRSIDSLVNPELLA